MRRTARLFDRGKPPSFRNHSSTHNPFETANDFETDNVYSDMTTDVRCRSDPSELGLEPSNEFEFTMHEPEEHVVSRRTPPPMTRPPIRSNTIPRSYEVTEPIRFHARDHGHDSSLSRDSSSSDWNSYVQIAAICILVVVSILVVVCWTRIRCVESDIRSMYEWMGQSSTHIRSMQMGGLVAASSQTPGYAVPLPRLYSLYA